MSPRASSSVVGICDMFSPNTRTWDPSKLARCFLPWEAEKVRGIYVSEEGVKDTLIWPLTHSGDYSVRNAYRLLVEVENLSLSSSSSPITTQSVWKKIWKLRVLNEIRHFLCCAAKDSLPTKQNWKSRHIPINDTCDGCRDQAETLLHCLWLCD